MRKNIFLLGAGAVLLMSSCGSNGDVDIDDLLDDYVETSSITIDNGLDTTAWVTISDADTTFEFELEGLSTEWASFENKTWHVVATTINDSVFLDEDFVLDGEHYSYNLNLTKEDYIVENIEYIVNEFENIEVPKSFTYQGETYDDVDARAIDGKLLMPNDWDYNLDEESPEEVEVPAGSNKVVKEKVYRSSTFLVYLILFELFNEYEGDGSDLY
jgi:hypothetical protein